jgi:prevent-host-death family protein
MDKVNALQLRQSLGKILQRLRRTGRPILVEKSRQPAAVLISLEDYRARFVDREADEARRRIVDQLRGAGLELPGDDAVTALRRLRDGAQ